MVVDAAGAKQIFASTLSQSLNPTWFAERRKQITAPVAHTILSMRPTTDPPRFVESCLKGSDFLHTEALQYGKDHEHLALETYMVSKVEESTPIRIESAGLVVSLSEPWFGA